MPKPVIITPKKSAEHRTRILNLRLEGQSFGEIAKTLNISRQRVVQLFSPSPEARKHIVEERRHKCENCGIGLTTKGSAHVHHQDRDCTNAEHYNEPENLRVLCVSCHRQAHGIWAGPDKLTKSVLFSFRPEQYELLEKWTGELGKPFTTAIRELAIIAALQAKDKEREETK